MDEKDCDVQIFTLEEAEKHLLELDPTGEYSNIVNMPHKHDLEKLLMISSAIEADIPPPMEYVLSPCLPRQGIGFIYAATGVGKTLFTMNLAYAIASGHKFLHYKALLPRKVLYVDGEMSYVQIHDRYKRIKNVQGALSNPENFYLMTPDKIAPHRIPMIDEPEGQEIYLRLLAYLDAEVVIFDNLSMLSSIDENKAQDWKKIQDFLIKLRTMGKTVLIVHHAGKEKTGYRGTSRMLDCADVAISLQAVNDNDLEADKINSKKFKIVYQKARCFGGRDAFPFEVSLENDQWSFSSAEQADLIRVTELHLLGLKQREIANDLGISLGKANKLHKKCRELKMINDRENQRSQG